MTLTHIRLSLPLLVIALLTALVNVPLGQPAQAQEPIVATPALLIVIATPSPAPEALTAAPAPPQAPIAPAPPTVADAAPTPAWEPPAVDVALNDPASNGGNVAPDGCPFPILNGVCANGLLASGASDEGVKVDTRDHGTARVSPRRDGPGGTRP